MHIIGVRVQSFKEWMADEDAKRAQISDQVEGLDSRQIGRTAWLKNANGECEYPKLKKLLQIEKADGVIDLNKSFQPNSKVGNQVVLVLLFKLLSIKLYFIVR